MRQVRDEDKERLEGMVNILHNAECFGIMDQETKKRVGFAKREAQAILRNMRDLCQEQPIPAPRIAEAT